INHQKTKKRYIISQVSNNVAHYNILADVVYNRSITAWRLRVNILMIQLLYSYVSGLRPNWSYILADEVNQEGQWVEIFRIEVDHAYPGFNATNSRFKLSATPYTKVHTIDPLNKHHYMEFKCISLTS
ncbi:hypothetical protein HID58_022770, partial [Brassica napus]